MKRLFYILLSAVLLLTVSLPMFGCDALNGYETYNKAMEKTKALTDLDYSIKLDASVSVSGSTIAMKSSGALKQKMQNDSMTMSGNMIISLLGNDIDTNIYYADGFAYYDYKSMGMKVKMNLSIEEMLDSTAGNVLDFDTNAIKVDEIIKEDGGYTYKVTLAGDAVKDTIIGMTKSLTENLGDDLSGISFSDIIATYTIKNDYVMYQKLEFTMNANIEPLSAMSMNFVMEYNLNNPGTPVTIDVPGDLDEYTDFGNLEDIAGLS